jgi:hypothetical protein
VTERELQRLILDLARMTGWHACHFHDSRRQVRPGVFVGDKDAAGFPDIFLCHPQHGVAVAELKDDKGKIRPAQADWLEWLEEAGVRCFVWRPRDWDDIATFLKTGGAPPLAAGKPGVPVAALAAAPPTTSEVPA